MSAKRTGPRILLIRLSSIGDCVMASPLAHVLRRSFPDAWITWVVQDKSAAVVEGNPYIDEVLLWKGGYKHLWEIVREIRKRKFDVVMDLQGLTKSTILMAFSGAPKRLVSPRFKYFAKWLSTERVQHPPGYIYPSLRYLYWAKQMGADISDIEADLRKMELTVPLFPEDHAAAAKVLEDEKLNQAPLLIGLNPGCSAVNRTWPADRFGAAANEILRQVPQASFVIFGSKDDVEAAAEIERVLPAEKVANAAGKLKLRASAALIQRCSAFITNDTGPMHMSVAVGTPVVGVFGKIDASQRLPLVQGHRGVEHNEGCRPPNSAKCSKGEICACLMSVTAHEVAQAVEEVVRLSQAQSSDNGR